MWQKRLGHEHDHIDGRTLVHHVHLFNSHTGAEHHLQLMLGNPICAHCSRPHPQSDLGLVNPHAAVDEALEMLHANHEAVMRYSCHHNVPIRTGPLHLEIPDTHQVVAHSTLGKLLVKKR